MAFLIVQHLGPGHASMLAEIISKKTPMPVTEATEGHAVEPNHVYVIPPNTSMTIAGGKIALRPRNDAQGLPLPVDDLLRSLAKDRGAHAIGVSLSGSGSDGALGIQAIKEEGGITFAQDEASARFSGMPQAAIKLESVDFILPPQEIARELARIARHPFLSPEPATVEGSSAADAACMTRIFHLMNKSCNMDFTNYKSGTVKRRMARRMALSSIQSLETYSAFLETNPGEVKALCQDFLIHVTSFFRDPEIFEELAKSIFPRMMKDHSAGMSLRIWVPGCASGEEVYSIAICLLEYLGAHAASSQIQFFGTDVSEAALELARAGVYSENIAKHVSPERLKRYFVKTDNRYQIVKSIRECCIFARHNVTRDPPFSRLDLISCRNLLIYLDPVLQKRVIPLFHYALNPEGMLMLGPSETIGGFSELFSVTEDKKFRVYMKKPLPVRTQLEYMGGYISQSAPHKKAAFRTAVDVTGAEKQKREADRVALARYAPVGVLCDENLNILEFRGDTSPYLTQPSGTPSANLKKLARPGLLVEIGNAIAAVGDNTVPAQRADVRIETPQGTRQVSVEAIAMPVSGTPGSCFLVSFREIPDAAQMNGAHRGFWAALMNSLRSSPSRGTAAQKGGGDGELARLNRELDAAHGHIAAMIEEHEIARNELQASEEEMLSSNEEFQSTNEELETAKEELQSANEELTTTNEELRHRNRELSDLNVRLQQTLDYAEAIINTVRQPLLVLDSELHVLRANPAFYETFKTKIGATEKTMLYELGNGQWNIPDLRKFLGETLSKNTTMTDYTITHAFPDIGKKTMRLNATHLAWENRTLILLAIEDVSNYTKALDTLQDNDRRKDEFLAMLAHELRNPLAPIQTALEILKRGDAGAEADNEARLVMERQLEKEIRLVDDLLDVSRITRGSIALREDAIDLAQVVNQAVEGVRHHFETRKHEFTMTLPEKALVVKGDALRLEQIVSNLLINAAKYTPPGGHIALTLAEEAGKAVLTVADDGIGISPDLLPRIFDLFVQAELSIDRSQGGLGIGLTLVHRLVELQGGTVEAKSAGLRQGSQFIVRLPVLEGAVPLAASTPAISKTPFVPHRILVVDDNVDAANTSALLLNLLGHKVKTAIDGVSGIEAARTFKPEVVLLDIGLPGMDGYEVARRLRNTPETADSLIIAISGYGQAEDRRRSKEAGFDHHVVKPATMEKLSALIL